MVAAMAILREEVRKKDEVIGHLDEQLKRQQATIDRMQVQLEDLLRRMYGRRSEKLDINQLQTPKSVCRIRHRRYRCR